VPADNSTTSTVTVTLKDTYGNPVSGKTVTLAQTSGSGTPSVSAASGTSTSLGVVTFTVKSITPATDVFTATDSSDTVTVTQTASVTFTTAPPVATTMTVPRPAGLTAKISLADLATNWSDVYSYPVTLTGFSLTSTNGASVYSLNLTTNSGVITASSSSFLGYVNAANVNDQISYTISDGHGNTATGLINIVVSTSPLFGQASTVVPGGPTSTVNFAGQPGYTYTIERSTNLVTGTGWVPLETTNAPAAGPFSYVDHFTDLGGTPPGSAYYRLEWIP
jgi:adhesin/invasin